MKIQAEGIYKRVLCVCAAGMLRSATAAWVLSHGRYKYNTRACGVKPFALIPLSPNLLNWADEIVIMQPYMLSAVEKMAEENSIYLPEKGLQVLDIEDDYNYRDPKLIRLIRERYKAG